MSIENKAIKLITKLIRETASNNVTWNVSNPPRALVLATEDEIYTYFQADYKDKVVAIFERKSKYFIDEHEFYWTSSDVFAVLDNENRILLEFSQISPALRDLFSTVREQVADLDSLLDDLLE
ncbi:hypothetical protein GNP63_01550 [Aliivibrio fischeri]|uniref:hypothetical protein n=1 Tax=Aliivibrio fischeri TaxID=668 RepID=UPI0012D90243|nr:hypothetical protein [Aliivibrio fischeri]MUH95237.1 hypothetical protein [Aliivibrio fischeri]MUI65465.1 hypothetical protein [Aliivibrio fischeri]